VSTLPKITKIHYHSPVAFPALSQKGCNLNSLALVSSIFYHDQSDFGDLGFWNLLKIKARRLYKIIFS
jgi:hypothetical protein